MRPDNRRTFAAAGAHGAGLATVQRPNIRGEQSAGRVSGLILRNVPGRSLPIAPAGDFDLGIETEQGAGTQSASATPMSTDCLRRSPYVRNRRIGRGRRLPSQDVEFGKVVATPKQRGVGESRAADSTPPHRILIAFSSAIVPDRDVMGLCGSCRIGDTPDHSVPPANWRLRLRTRSMRNHAAGSERARRSRRRSIHGPGSLRSICAEVGWFGIQLRSAAAAIEQHARR